MSLRVATCLFGTIRMCVGAWGLMSLKASTRSSSSSAVAGIFRSMILQKRQSAMRHNSNAMHDAVRPVVRVLYRALACVALVIFAAPLLHAADQVDVRTNLTYY